MSNLKAEIKMGTASEIGARLDDMLEQAHKEVSGYEGGKLSLNIAYGKLNEHIKYIDKDLEEGKITIEQAELVKRYFMQGLGIVQSLATMADIQRLTAQGKVAAYDASVKATKAIYDVEKAKARAIVAAIESDGLGHVPGTHPGDPLAERRNEVAPEPKVKVKKSKKAAN